MKNAKRTLAIFIAVLLSLSMFGLAASSARLPANDQFSLSSALSDVSFVEFTGTFSELQGSPRSRSAFSEETLVQFEALYSLFEMGVRDADRWIEDTTIDLSPYGDFWVVIDLETGSEYNKAVIDGQLQEIEVGFEPNPPEINAIRQALLAPHTIVNVESFHTPIAPLNNGRPRAIVTNVRATPYNAIGVITGSWSNSTQPPSEGGTAFLVRNNVAVTAGHNLRHRDRGTRQQVTLSVARDRNLVVTSATRSASRLVLDPGWGVNFNSDFDIGMIVFLPGTSFPGATPLRLQAPASLPSQLLIAGYPAQQTGAINPRIMTRSTGRLVGSTARFITSENFTTNGMSGSPSIVMPNLINQHVVGVNVGANYANLARSIRITQSFITLVNAQH